MTSMLYKLSFVFSNVYLMQMRCCGLGNASQVNHFVAVPCCGNKNSILNLGWKQLS
jgi:hypothetical protein